jgi:DNA-binding SARP family transcriptional activator
MHFQLLGTLQVEREGKRVDIGGLRQQKLLAMLLLDANRVVTADRLIEAMWDGEPPVTARRQLHNAVAAIRRSFASAKYIVVKDGPGYRIQIDPQNIDSSRFMTTVARASVAAAEKRDSEAIELLTEGLAIGEGPALSGLNSPVLDIAAAKLEEKRLCATEQLLGLRLARGDSAAGMVPQLGELVSQHPSREETRRLLILALHKSGRKADALNVYEQGRRLLRDEMGVDPSIGLRELYERILRDEPPKTADPAPARAVGVNRSFLPYDTAHFTGRVDELRFLTRAQRTAGTALSIVSIDGMPGVGKTTLAVRLAHQMAQNYPEGHLFVDLHGHSRSYDPLDPDAALERLLLDFGLPAEHIPTDSRQRAARWRAAVAERRILVVLDNARDAEQVRPLLPGTGKAQVIITSRRRLAGLDGVTSRSLDVLSETDAVALFTKIAGADRVSHRPDAVEYVVALCGCLPLAVSIAASRFHNRPAWSLDHLIFRLRDDRQRLGELSLGARSVTASFEDSYRNLSDELRGLFRVLGFTIKAGQEFDAASVATMMDIPVAAADRLLEELFDAHLLSQRTAGHYYLHELLRQHAQTKALAPTDGRLAPFHPANGIQVQATV